MQPFLIHQAHNVQLSANTPLSIRNRQSVLTVLLRREAEEGEVDRRDVSVERGRDGAVFWGLAPLGETPLVTPDDLECGL